MLYRTTTLRVLQEIHRERDRQIDVLKWTPEHDSEHDDGSLAVAGGCYALATSNNIEAVRRAVEVYPWGTQGPSSDGGSRRMLIKAASLIVAEIERRDRKEQLEENESEAQE